MTTNSGRSIYSKFELRGGRFGVYVNKGSHDRGSAAKEVMDLGIGSQAEICVQGRWEPGVEVAATRWQWQLGGGGNGRCGGVPRRRVRWSTRWERWQGGGEVGQGCGEATRMGGVTAV
jgi:hypothetical protein